MHKISFEKTMRKFDLIVSDMNDANKNNNIMFRRVCKEVFQKSYSKLEIQNNFNIGRKMLRVGTASAIKMARGRYKKGSFGKSFKKLNNQTNTPTYSDLKKINRFLDTSEFIFVTKLLKIQYNYGLNGVISFINSH